MRVFGALGALFLIAAVEAAPIRFEPPSRKVQSVEIRRAGDETATTVRVDGESLNLPPLTPPLVIERAGFEPVTYTAADVDSGKPIVLRALGTLAGKISRKGTKEARFTWLLRPVNASEPIEIDFTAGADQRFSIDLPAGIYQGAILGDGMASYTIAAIVIRPGEITEQPKPIALEPAAPVSFRVIDKATNKPVAGARVEWNPPSKELNSATSRVLFRKRWSGVTGRDGRITFGSIGPVPIPVRWRIEAPSYPSVESPTTQLRADDRLKIPDVALRRPSTLTVRVSGPRNGEMPEGTLELWSGSEDSLDYKHEKAAPLKAGETVFRDVRYGKKQIRVVGNSDDTLLYEDFRIADEHAAINVILEPVELHGRVTRGGALASGIRVEFAHEHDPAVRLARVTTNFLGRYEATTWKRGRVTGYAIENSPPGKSSGAAHVELFIEAGAREHEANFVLPAREFTIYVVDGVTNRPIPSATVHARIQPRSGGLSMGRDETDAEGRLRYRNLEEGTAKLFIKAKNYRAAETEIVITDAPQPDVRIALQPARTISGRVVNAEGLPVAGALIEGGYPIERSSQATFVARTNARGEFQFDSAPMIGTPFYAMAPGYALAVTSLRAGEDNLIRLERPSNGVVYLTDRNGAPPRKVYRIVAAPSGGTMVPLGVLEDLAQVNGLTSFQLLSNGRDGSSILAEFLGSGSWDLFITKRGGDPYIYERIGSVITPLRGAPALKVAE